MNQHISIHSRNIGHGQPTYIIAEMSANHGQDYGKAVEIIHAMKESGADAVKLQTYTPDTMTIECEREEFRIGKGTIWEGKTLYELYGEAYTPWEWQPKLKDIANDLGMDLFSTPFDATSVDFLEKMDVPAYKIASFELVDIPLIEQVAKTGKPIIISTGMGSEEEIRDAVNAVQQSGNNQLVLLKCTSTYPAPPEDMNLRTIPDMIEQFGVPVGLSDHSLDATVPVAAVALGACVIEKHFCLSRNNPGPDSSFSLEPDEFRKMTDAIRNSEKLSESDNAPDESILGNIQYGVSETDRHSIKFRRSIFAVKDIAPGEEFTKENVRSIRPSHGLKPKELSTILGKRAKQNIERGTPLTKEHTN